MSLRTGGYTSSDILGHWEGQMEACGRDIALEVAVAVEQSRVHLREMGLVEQATLQQRSRTEASVRALRW